MVLKNPYLSKLKKEDMKRSNECMNASRMEQTGDVYLENDGIFFAGILEILISKSKQFRSLL